MSNITKRQGRHRVYSKEFIVRAARLIIDEGMTVSKVASDLGIPEGTLSTWMHKFRSGVWSSEPSEVNDDLKKSNRPSKPTAMSEDKKKILDLEAKLARLTQERDILKKAMAYFANPQK